MKFNITRDQHDNRVLQAELPFTGYFLIRREGLRPALALEHPQFDYFIKFTRSLGLIGTLITILDIFALAVGFTFWGVGVSMVVLAAIAEIINVIELEGHQVVRASVETVEISEPPGAVEISEPNAGECKEGK